MGCDMHTFIEYKKPSDTEWQEGNLYHRTYPGQQATDATFERTWLKSESSSDELFAALANVRGTGGICDPRGLPADVSRRAFIEVGSWKGAAHSTSYFTLAELLDHLPNYPVLQKLVEELEYRRGVLVYFTEPENFRLIFWFDS